MAAFPPVVTSPGAPETATAHTNAVTASNSAGSRRPEFEVAFGLALRGTSRAVSRGRTTGILLILGVQTDRLDDQVKSIGTVDLARYAVGHTGPDEQGFGEVVEPVDALSIAVLH